MPIKKKTGTNTKCTKKGFNLKKPITNTKCTKKWFNLKKPIKQLYS